MLSAYGLKINVQITKGNGRRLRHSATTQSELNQVGRPCPFVSTGSYQLTSACPSLTLFHWLMRESGHIPTFGPNVWVFYFKNNFEIVSKFILQENYLVVFCNRTLFQLILEFFFFPTLNSTFMGPGKSINYIFKFMPLLNCPVVYQCKQYGRL